MFKIVAYTPYGDLSTLKRKLVFRIQWYN